MLQYLENAKFTSTKANTNNEKAVPRPRPLGKETQHALGIASKAIQNNISQWLVAVCVAMLVVRPFHLKKSSIDKHIKSSKHTDGVARIAKDKKQSQSIMECLKRRDMREHPSESTLPAEIRLFRFEIVECIVVWRYTPIKSGCSTPSVGEIWPEINPQYQPQGNHSSCIGKRKRQTPE